MNIIAISNNLYDSTGLFEKKDVVYIKDRHNLTVEKLNEIKPEFVFFPHWSFIIPPEIYEQFNCVIFHMTDLPFGRGGSPLQNLIERSIYRTKISAIKCIKELDAGDIYLQQDFSLLEGTAGEIYLKAAKVISEMIDEIIKSKPIPKPQVGDVVVFKRRTAEQSNISGLTDLTKIFDFIRMLDCEGYPRAFIDDGNVKYEFFNAELRNNKIVASVEIQIKK